jgi:hypothetical protein
MTFSDKRKIAMNLYRFDNNLHIVEKGQCDSISALIVYEECFENGLKSYESGEEAISLTSFGISRSNEDFIELSCHGHDSITVHSDRLHYPSWLSKTFGLKNHLFIKGDKTKGKEVIQDFFALTRQEFEGKYADFQCR